MSCKVERYGAGAPEGRLPGEVKSMTFHCDHEGCDVSPTDKEITDAGGLTKMGWFAAGGRHYCPEHHPGGTHAPQLHTVARQEVGRG